MKNEEFEKLKYWIDAEFTMVHIWLAIIIGILLDNKLAWYAIAFYALVSLIYAGARLNYIESKHKGYLKLPKNK